MIDAPDHAVEERGNRSAGAWLLVALLGIVLSVAAGMMSYGYMTAQAEQRFADVVDYVATQSLSYDAFNSAYTTKNLIRVMEIAGEAARDMERDGSVDNATLEQYADQFNVSALIVTDASGNLVSESSTDGVGYESLTTYLKESPVLEVATHPLKSYTARITLADDSVADIGCVTHLKRLLLNIAGNAVKYNRQGGYVRLVCREVEPADGAPVYEYTIADNGIGMSEEFQQHLYEPFCREEQQVEGASSGTGLGAPIAKQLVELMGGTMSFTSVLGQGTTFTIRLPFEKCDRSEIPQAVRVDAGDGDALQGLRVLLVEDNDLNAEIAQFTLGRAGAVVTHVKDGESAVEAFAASAPHEYDVVLMDIMMPGIDGLEATRQIRALDREDAATTPIIAVSANAFADDRRLSREAGMDAHLSKPVSSQELVEALAHITADAS